MAITNSQSAGRISWRTDHPSRWIRFNHRLVTLCGRLAALLFVLIAAMITYEVIARYLFRSPTIWVEDLTLLCQIWASCMGACWLLQHQALIRIDMLTRRFGPTGRKLAELWSLFVIGLFSAWVTFYGTELLLDTIRTGATSPSMLGLPIWITQSAIPFGFGLLLLQCITEAILVCAGRIQETDEVAI